MSSGALTACPNVGQALEAWAEALTIAEAPEPGLTAEWLLADVVGCSRLGLPFRASEPLSLPQQERLEVTGRRLLEGEPLQYALGHTDFMGLRLLTDSRALIPRPETEGLVEQALELLQDRQGEPLRGADVGTGTGCIAIALASKLPHARFQALDISRQALELAGTNVTSHGLSGRVVLREADLMDGIDPASLDLVISNPPYITHEEWEALPDHIRRYEPGLALQAGEDGLAVIRRLAMQARTRLRGGGVLLLEIGSAQGQAVTGLLRDAGFRSVILSQDLSGRDRYVRGDT